MRKMYKKIIIIFLSVLCSVNLVFAKCSNAGIESVIASEDVINYAKEVSKQHFYTIKDDFGSFGFKNTNPYSYKLGGYFTIYNYIDDSVIYEFAILSNDEIVGFLEVTDIEGELCSIMSKSFAEEMNKLFIELKYTYELISNGNQIYAVSNNDKILVYSQSEIINDEFDIKYGERYSNNMFVQTLENIKINATFLCELSINRGSTSSPLSYKTLNVSPVRQYKDTCWAATCAAIINYKKGLNLTYYDVSSFIHPNNPYTAGTVGECCTAYFHWNIATTTHNKISFSSIKTEINNFRPMHLYLYKDAIYGHMVSLIGYEDWEDRDIVILLEPNDGLRKTVTLTSSGGFNYILGANTYTWARTIKIS